MLKPTLLLLLLTLPATAQRVKTTQGIVEGEATPDGQVLAFKGIPYAAPPVGPLRWAPPAAAAPWTGIRAAHDFGPHCVQSSSYPDMYFHDPGASEDCLTLNVWTPKRSPNAAPARLPVMVWIYGGGFSTGGTSEYRQDGQFLAHRNVLVVSMNYRLGIFGFFTHPELAAQSPHHAAGNYGLLDQLAALQWVHDNIAAFGGDPTNVTLFGESAGSMSVSAHMASPLSHNLVQKAIGESGGSLGGVQPNSPTLDQRAPADAAFALKAYGTSSLAALRRLPTEDILRPILTGKSNPRFGPVLDGYFWPQDPAAIFAAGQQNHIPLLAGWNAGESQGSITAARKPFTPDNLVATAHQDFPTHAEDFLQLYPATPEAARDSAIDYAGDRFIAFATWKWLEAAVRTGHSPVYRYSFDLPNPGDRFHPTSAGAFHSDDIEYVFGTLDSRLDAVIRPEDRALSSQIQTYWTNFARTGNPNGPPGDQALPNWPLYQPTDWSVLHLDRTSAAHPDTKRPRYLFLNQSWSTP
jgi:para-nitrobenzyl esterase